MLDDAIDFLKAVTPFVAAIVFVVWIVLFVVRGFYIDAACSSLGYRDSNEAWNFRAYCIRRVNQTDEVVTLDSARALARRK